MKKRYLYTLIISIIFVGLIAAFVFLANGKSHEPYDFSENLFSDTSHENSNVTIKYPQINNEDYSEINKIIKDFAENIPSHYYPSDYINLGLEMDYKIPYKSKNWISVVFEGIGYVRTAAHPNKLIYAININLSDASIVSLSDIYTINDEVEKIIRDDFQSQFAEGQLERLGYDKNDDSYETLKEKFSTVGIFDCQYLVTDSSRFYLSENGIVFCVDVIHAIGDYYELEIKYSELKDLLKIKSEPFI